MSGAGVSLVYVLAADQKRGREKERESCLCEGKGRYRGLGRIAVSLQVHLWFCLPCLP
jgi:hypothetical protein